VPIFMGDVLDDEDRGVFASGSVKGGSKYETLDEEKSTKAPEENSPTVSSGGVALEGSTEAQKKLNPNAEYAAACREEASVPGSNSMTATAAMELLKRGRTFRAYFVDPASAKIERTEVAVFYVPDESATKLGKIYWCFPGERQKSDQHCFPLGSVSDVYVGKTCPVMQAASLARSETSFSIISRLNAQLHLEDQSFEMRNQWLAAMAQVMSSGRKNVTVSDVNEQRKKAQEESEKATRKDGQKGEAVSPPTSPRGKQITALAPPASASTSTASSATPASSLFTDPSEALSSLILSTSADAVVNAVLGAPSSHSSAPAASVAASVVSPTSQDMR